MRLSVPFAAAALLGCIMAGRVAAEDVIALDSHFEKIAWQKYQNEAVDLLQKYLRLDTSNPPGHEEIAAEFFHKLFDAAGIPNTVYAYAPGRANICARLKGDGSLRAVVLLNHMDVVRADPASWKFPPFSAEIVDGMLYGRGAEDMKDEGLLQAMVMLVAAREHLPLKRDLIFLATSDEEVGDTGSAWVIEQHPELVRGAEYMITEGGSNLVHPGGRTVDGVGFAEKAPFWLRLTAIGRGGHGSIPITDSAPNALIRALNRVINWEPPIRLLPAVEIYFHEIAALEKEPHASAFLNIRESLKNPAFAKELTEDEDLNYLLRDTVSLTMLQGSQQTNVIPALAVANLDVRLLPGEDPAAFLAEMKSVIADDRIRIEPIGTFRPPNASSTDTTLYHIIEQTIRRFNRQTLVAPILNGGYTECQMYRALGISCYGWSPVEVTSEVEASEHAANERVPVDQIRRGVRTFYEVVARAANTP